MKMEQAKLLLYQTETWRIAKANGRFKDPQQDRGELVMLMITELGECCNAHRYGYTISKGMPQLLNVVPFYEDFAKLYENHVKDKVEDEIADVVIRILNYCKFTTATLYDREYRKESTGNFAHDLLRINWYIMQAYHEQDLRTTTGKDWGYALAAIASFCDHWKIDVIQHIDWKLRYSGGEDHH